MHLFYAFFLEIIFWIRESRPSIIYFVTLTLSLMSIENASDKFILKFKFLEKNITAYLRTLDIILFKCFIRYCID